MNIDLILAFSLFSVGFLYASVGHGGASGYLAVLSIFAIPVLEFRSMILILNMLVAGMGFIQFYRAGYFRWNLCWPFLLTSIPFAFIGSKFPIHNEYYHLLLGLALLFPVVKLLGLGPKEKKESKNINLPIALLTGVVLGFLSGLLNIGGGIFLSPLVILLAWANAKEAAAVSAIFIVLNSFSGLLGSFSVAAPINDSMYSWFIAALAGGWIGAYFGSHKLAVPTVRYLLTGVLAIASFKLLFLM